MQLTDHMIFGPSPSRVFEVMCYSRFVHTFPNLPYIQISTDERACVFIRWIVLVPRVTFRDANPPLWEVHLLCIVVLAPFWDIRPQQVGVTKSLRESPPASQKSREFGDSW